MSDRSEDIARRASDNRFRRRREALVEALGALLGPRLAPEPLANSDCAATLAAEVRTAYRGAEEQAWGVVRGEWSSDDRGAVVDVLHAFAAALGPRSVWLVIPDREPQVVPLESDVALDNPLGFVALADHELTLFDQPLRAGLTLTRHSHFRGHARMSYSWEVEAWGSEPWLSTLTGALRQVRGEPGADAG
jgi:hypothetical protein